MTPKSERWVRKSFIKESESSELLAVIDVTVYINIQFAIDIDA